MDKTVVKFYMYFAIYICIEIIKQTNINDS